MKAIVIEQPGVRICIRIDVMPCPGEVREVKLTKGQLEQALFLATLKTLSEVTHAAPGKQD